MTKPGFKSLHYRGRSRNGFTQNPNRVWGHCETSNPLFKSGCVNTRPCIDATSATSLCARITRPSTGRGCEEKIK
jgi:hypothetical protein